jgi:hypothetical protein
MLLLVMEWEVPWLDFLIGVLFCTLVLSIFAFFLPMVKFFSSAVPHFFG